MTVKESLPTLTEAELKRNLRAVDNAIAQQRLEGLTVSEATVDDMRRAAHGEIPSDKVISNIYDRFRNVAILKR